MSHNIGTMRKVPIKEVWANEERDFTPWLKEHGLKLLLEKIGIEDVKGAEDESRCAGKSEADLVVTYLEGDEVKTLVIENQYGKSNPDHLGRLLMYSADKKASVVVWITEDAKPEYVKTVDWLNENCSANVEFYLVGISLYAIGDSLPAPVFEVLVAPKDDGTKVEADKNRSEASSVCFGFWQSCLDDSEFMESLRKAKLRQRKANGDRWKDYSIGSSDVWLCAGVTTERGRIKACFTMKNGSKAHSRLMSAETREKMKACFGVCPEDGQLGTKAYSTLNFYNGNADIAASDTDRAVARKWFAAMLPKMKAFLESEGIIKSA